MPVLKMGAKARIGRELDHATRAIVAAVKAVEDAVSMAHELEAPPTPTEIEAALSDGWLAVIAIVASTSALDGHEGARTALLDEIERRFVSATSDPARILKTDEPQAIGSAEQES